MEDHLAVGEALQLGWHMPAAEEVDPLVGGAEEAAAHVLGLDVPAGDKHIEMSEDAVAERPGANLLKGVAAEGQAAEAGVAKAFEKVEKGLGLLEGFAAGDGEPINSWREGEDFVGEVGGVGLVAAAWVVGVGIEATGATQCAALEPDDGAEARAVGPTGWLKGVEADSHSDPRSSKKPIREHRSRMKKKG